MQTVLYERRKGGSRDKIEFIKRIIKKINYEKNDYVVQYIALGLLCTEVMEY